MKLGSFETAYGLLSKERLSALIQLRSMVLRSVRASLEQERYVEVTAASIVNFAGSCENPNASFPITFYGRQAYLSQSAQLQLEPIVLRLRQRAFTQATSFRAEDYDDPDSPRRRLSEFTLLEAEGPFANTEPDLALEQLASLIEKVVRKAIADALAGAGQSVALLGGDERYLRRVLDNPFARITWDRACGLLGIDRGLNLDLGISEERQILRHFNGLPVFVLKHPSEIKFFNLKRTHDGSSCYSVDLLLPPLGETVGGGLREESAEKIEKTLLDSKLGKFLRDENSDPRAVFGPYLEIVDQEGPLLRGGFGLGFERFVAFLIGSSDILETVLDRTTAVLSRSRTG